MAETSPADIAVAPLSRALLDGVDDGGTRRRVDLGVLPCFEDERPLQGLSGLVDWRTGGSLSALLRSGLCTGAAGEAVLLPGRPILPMERVVLLGLGSSRAFDRAAAEATGERLVALVEGLRPHDVLVAMPGRAPERTVVEAIFEGLTRALARRLPRDLDARAQLAAKAVGDESSGPVLVEDPVASPMQPSGPSPVAAQVGAGPRPMLAPAVEADDPRVGGEPTATMAGPERSAGGGGATSKPEAVSREGSSRGSAPKEIGPESGRSSPLHGPRRWWVVADPRHEARLRRLLEGPPRAAEPSSMGG
ncbi:M17 family peptidase N-terminal domain-containing protein [Paraliomyxa miuraensis]|uniref:M17 family peptidase N-terminal domain-containing protein n=1 Tax=Paraliomyxa miuraensis TaxID=376150 RepID=UPI00224FD8C2|nr:M17 family peptidase N-terminal domain-containing protein [Paraliomyxa miuraensis]MCX4245793.1 hypothetical protein [Paraliomyxa miuraensis]